MTSCVASRAPRPCLLRLSWWVSFVTRVVRFLSSHTSHMFALYWNFPRPRVLQFWSFMTFALLLYWRGFCCLLRASTVLILCCISLDMLLSHTPPCFCLVVPSSLHLGNRLNKTLKHWILLIAKFKPSSDRQKVLLIANPRLFTRYVRFTTQVLAKNDFVTSNKLLYLIHFTKSIYINSFLSSGIVHWILCPLQTDNYLWKNKTSWHSVRPLGRQIGPSQCPHIQRTTQLCSDRCSNPRP